MIIKIEKPEELIKQLGARPLVLYGMGTIGMEIAEWCDSQQIEYVFADKNAGDKQKNTRKTVVTPEVLTTGYIDANIVVSTNIYFDEIRDSLLKNGFPKEQILPYALFIPQNIAWPDLEDNINWDLMRPSVELFSGWIDESIKSVADYGAGQMYLKTFLRPDMEYYPIDYIKRFDETIVCDLNTGTFPDLQVDVSVFNGVLEFLSTAQELLKYACSKTAGKVIISYMTANKFPNKTARRASGYVSDLTEEQILCILGESGFRLVRKVSDPLDDTDTLYLFEK